MSGTRTLAEESCSVLIPTCSSTQRMAFFRRRADARATSAITWADTSVSTNAIQGHKSVPRIIGDTSTSVGPSSMVVASGEGSGRTGSSTLGGVKGGCSEPSWFAGCGGCPLAGDCGLELGGGLVLGGCGGCPLAGGSGLGIGCGFGIGGGGGIGSGIGCGGGIGGIGIGSGVGVGMGSVHLPGYGKGSGIGHPSGFCNGPGNGHSLGIGRPPPDEGSSTAPGCNAAATGIPPNIRSVPEAIEISAFARTPFDGAFMAIRSVQLLVLVIPLLSFRTKLS